MANNGELSISKVPGHPDIFETSEIFLSNYNVPLFWLMILEADDLQTFLNEDDVTCYFASIKIDTAIERTEKRTAKIEELISNIKPYIKMWTSFLAKGKKRAEYITLELTQIIEMDTAGVSAIKDALKIWDEISEANISSFFGLTSLVNIYTIETMAINLSSHEDIYDPLFGYMPELHNWVPWAPKITSKERRHELNWHPAISGVCLLSILYQVFKHSRWGIVEMIGLLIVALWFSLSIYNTVSGGKVVEYTK